MHRTAYTSTIVVRLPFHAGRTHIFVIEGDDSFRARSEKREGSPFVLLIIIIMGACCCPCLKSGGNDATKESEMTGKRKSAQALPGSKGQSMAISRKMSAPTVEITDVMKVCSFYCVRVACLGGSNDTQFGCFRPVPLFTPFVFPILTSNCQFRIKLGVWEWACTGRSFY